MKAGQGVRAASHSLHLHGLPSELRHIHWAESLVGPVDISMPGVGMHDLSGAVAIFSHVAWRSRKLAFSPSVGDRRVTTLVEEAPALEAPTPPSHRRNHLLVAGCIYLATSIVLWSHIWILGDPARSTTCACGDAAQQLWWLEWFPQALLHGHNPFYSSALFARFGGINAMSNTSWMLPAAVLSPITLLWGPIASSNVANLLAPVLSGVAAFALASRFMRSFAARTVAGAVFAFSPFVIRNTVLGHLGFTLIAYVPLVLLVGDKLVRRELPAVRAGLLLGGLTVLEFFIGVEVIVFTAFLAMILLAGTAIVRREVLLRAARDIAVAAGVSCGVCAVALSYPLWVAVAGRNHVAGPYWPNAGHTLFGFLQSGEDFNGISRALQAIGYAGPIGPRPDFVGLGILVVLALCAPVIARRRAYAVLAVAASACLLFESAGSRQWHAIPIVSSASQSRLALVAALVLGLMLGMVIDGWLLPARPWLVRLTRSRGRWVGSLAAIASVLVAIVPVASTYSVPFVIRTARVPAWFSRDASDVPSDRPVLVIPFAWEIRDEAMAWQAETGIRFSLVGGWGFIPGSDHSKDEVLSPLASARFLRQVTTQTSSITPLQASRFHALLTAWSPIEVVLVEAVTPVAVSRNIRDMLGSPSSSRDGSLTWIIR